MSVALRMVVLIFVALVVAVVSGFGSAYLALSGNPPLGAVRVGPWTAWPRTGSNNIDPYARAIVARNGELPLGLGEGLLFLASTDGTSTPLDARCRYRLSGEMPPARAWTLTLFDEDRRLIEDARGRSSFTSYDVLRGVDGRAVITLSRDVAPGNWLTLPDSGRFMLALRLYDTPASSASSAIEARSMPTIERIGCA